MTALRLFERGGFALGPVAWTRIDGGTLALGPARRRAAGHVCRDAIPADQEDELRAFCNLVARRTPNGGEIAWALSRFEMGCERLAPFEALTDYLLALRALLEPEGPASGRLAGRPGRDLRQARGPGGGGRADRACDLARARGDRRPRAGADPASTRSSTSSPSSCGRCSETCLCGHLEPDLCAVADDLLAQAAV